MPKILAIDDKKDNLVTLSALLKNLMPDCAVITAQSGMKGIEKARAELPDAILLDVKMPEMDGFETCRRLKSDERTKHLPVIMITAIKTDPQSRIKGLEIGADAFLAKPIDEYELVSQVKVALRIKNAEDALRVERDSLEEAVQERTATLRDAETRYRMLFEHSPDGILIIDPATARPLEFNETTHRQLGYSRDEFSGLTIFDLEAAETHEETRLRIAQVIREGRIDFETRQRTRQGEIRNVNVTAQIIEVMGKPLYHCVWHDITERKRAEAELKKRNVFIETVLENAPIGFAVNTIHDGQRVFLSRNFEKIYGVPPDSIHSVTDYFEKVYLDPVFREDIRKRIMADMATGEIARMRWENIPITTQTGDHKVVTAINIPLPEQNLMISTVQDVTERKEAENKLQDTLNSLRNSLGVTIQVMVSAVETRDPYTAGHQVRSADLARSIATEMGLSQEKIDAIRMAGSIHDIGKLSVPAEILSKPTKLSEIEFSLIKEHARKGFEILKDVESSWPLAEMVYQHHERMDGSGYPRHLKGDDILIEARILAVADVVESMASHRPYRPALGLHAALEEIEKNRGIFYDEAIVDTCLRLFREKGYRFAEA